MSTALKHESRAALAGMDAAIHEVVGEGKDSARPAGKACAPWPWLKLWTGQWSEMTRDLTSAERGVLIDLLVYIWEFGGPIAEDHSRLARRCGTTKVAFSRTVDLFLAKGILERRDEKLSSKYMAAEFANREKISSVRSKSAKSYHEKSEQNQQPTKANASKEEERIREEDNGGENPPPFESASTSNSTIDDSGHSMINRRAPEGAPTVKVDEDYHIPGVGIGWIEEVLDVDPAIFVVCTRDDNGIATRYRVEHSAKGLVKAVEIELNSHREVDHDAA